MLTPALRQRKPTTLAATALVLVTACSGSSKVAAPLRSAPEPAVAPSVQSYPAGTILALAGAPEGVAIDRSGTVAVSVREPNGVVLFDLSTPMQRRTVPLSGSARHLFLAGPDGPLLIPQESDNRFVALSLPAGKILESVPVGRQPTTAIAVGPSTVFVADELANTIRIRDGAATKVVGTPPPAGRDGVARRLGHGHCRVRGRRTRPTGPTEPPSAAPTVAPARRTQPPAVAASTGSWIPTAVPSWASGSMTVGPRQVARIQVGAKPYGIAYDDRRSTWWITLTDGNRLAGLHLAGTSVTSRTTYATVEQPNTVAVDDTTGQRVLTGSTPQGALQLIPPGEPSF